MKRTEMPNQGLNNDANEASRMGLSYGQWKKIEMSSFVQIGHIPPGYKSVGERIREKQYQA